MLSKNIKKSGGFKNIKYRKYGSLMKTTYKSKKAPALTRQVIRSIAAKEVHKNIENKVANITSSSNSIPSYALNNQLLTISCIPYTAIGQGVGQGAKISNEFKIRNLTFNYVLRPAPYSSSTNYLPQPQIIMMFFGKVKNSKPIQPTSADYQYLWQTGNSSNTPYSNTLDLIATLNRDWFTVYKVCIHKVGPNAYDASQSGVGVTPTYQYYQNNDYKFNVVRKLNITKYAPKTLKFNDSTTQPTNDGLWMWAMACNADGSTRNTSNQSVTCYMDYNVTVTYEDA